MDLTGDSDLEQDSCPVRVGGHVHGMAGNLPHKDKHTRTIDYLKDDRCDSRCSSGYESLQSGNLGSEIDEGRFTSDEVAGLESLTLDNVDPKHNLPSIDEGFESTNDLQSTEYAKGKSCDSSLKLIAEDKEKEDSKIQQCNQLIEETFQQDDDGDTRLHTAIIQLLTSLSLYFISLCPTHMLLNLKNNYLQTPLHLAVITKQDVLTRKLMTTGAQVDSRDHKGNTPLHIAAREGYDYFVRILLEPIHYEEMRNNNYELPYQQVPQNLEARNYDGQVCVHLAAEGCHLEVLSVLLSKGANVNARDGKSGRTILHYAAESGCMPLLEYLVHQKHCRLEVDSITYGGLTPIMLAKGRGHEEAVSLLKESGAWCDSEESSEEEEMMEEAYDDIKINGVIVQ